MSAIGEYFLPCWIKKDRCALTYEIDEMEGMLFNFVLFLFILVNAYGFVILIRYWIRNLMAHSSQQN